MDLAMNPTRRSVEEQYGPWTNHNLALGNGEYTVGPQPTGADWKLRRYLQTVADLKTKPWSELRVLDLACLEGLYGLEFALQGARVVAIEGREANLAKALFAAQALNLGDRYEGRLEDVRSLGPDRHGMFDVVLCLGILYHLDAPAVFDFLRQVGAVCRHLVVVDTQLAPVPAVAVVDRGETYWGRWHDERNYTAQFGRPAEVLWSSLDNDRSFWFTRPSLWKFLDGLGFTSLVEVHGPAVPRYEAMRHREGSDRATFVGIKGAAIAPKASPLPQSLPPGWDEIEQLALPSV